MERRKEGKMEVEGRTGGREGRKMKERRKEETGIKEDWKQRKEGRKGGRDERML